MRYNPLISKTENRMSYKKHLPYLRKPAVMATGLALAFIAFFPQKNSIADGYTDGWPKGAQIESKAVEEKQETIKYPRDSCRYPKQTERSQ